MEATSAKVAATLISSAAQIEKDVASRSPATARLTPKEGRILWEYFMPLP